MPGERLVLDNGRFVDVRQGRIHPAGTRVVVERGRILSVGPQEAEGRILDLGGRFVIPGLVNTHSHIQLVTPTVMLGPADLVRLARLRQAQIEHALRECLARGVTNVHDALTYDLAPNRELAAMIEVGGIPGPRILQSVHVAPVDGPFVPRRTFKNRLLHAVMGMSQVDYASPDSGIVVFDPGATPGEVGDAVDRAIDGRGAGRIKLYDQEERNLSYKPGARMMTQEQLDAAVDRARERGLVTCMHHVTVDSFRRGLRAGVHSLAHLPIDGPLEDGDVEAFVEAGCFIEPTLTIAYHYSWDLEGHASHGHPRMPDIARLREAVNGAEVEAHWLPGLRAASMRGMELAARGSMRMAGVDMSHVFRYWSAYATHGMDNLRLVWEGARERIACGNDAGATWATQASIGLELRMLELCIGNAFTPADALRTATISSASALGVEGAFGTIEEGKVADLVILDGNPLEDQDLTGSRAAAVIKGGRLVVNACGLAPQRGS